MTDLLKRRTKVGNKPLYLCLIGPSKAGKSYVMGTMPGKILHYHGKKETHGADSAHDGSKASGNVVSVLWDEDKILADINQTLNYKFIKENGITSVAVDSLTELFEILGETSVVKQQSKDKDGNFNPWSEKRAIINVFTKVLGKLTDLNEQGIHIMASLHGTVQETEGGQLKTIKPDLPSFGVASLLVGAFPDIMILHKNPATGKRQFVTYVNTTRTSEDKNKGVTRYLDCQPCLRGSKDQLPEYIEPTVSALLALKGVK